MARTATDVVILCENVLGWVPEDNVPLWKARANHAGRLKRAMAKHGVTLDQLVLAVEYCRRRREPVKSPAALVFRVPSALDLANEPESTSDDTEAINEAIQWEYHNEDHFSLGWIFRLTRAVGAHRADVLKEWRDAGRG